MSSLKLFLLGSPRIELDGAPVEIQRRKALALLAYLALGGQLQPRDTLATLLWPDHSQQRARQALRRDLSDLNGVLGGAWLDANHSGVGLRPGFWLDVHDFQRQADESTPGTGVAPERLTDAAALYRDDFLAGFTLSDAPAFDEWQFFQSESLRQMLAAALDRLVAVLGVQGQAETAIPHARRRLTLDPLHEPAHRQLMQLYAQAGQHAAALRQYERCRQVLNAELGVPPALETTALYEQIRDRKTESGRAKAPLPVASLAPQHNLPTPTTPFIGRAYELVHLSHLLDDPDVRLVTILGPGGMGKTRLALEVAKQYLASSQARVYFVSLASLRAAEQMVTTIADAIGYHFQADQRSAMQQLLDYLRQKRLLLVLDNAEHLLDGVELVNDILQAAPGIKILATSRERLQLSCETVFALGGMPLQDWKTPEEALAHDTVHLLLHGARRVRPDFALVTENLPDIAHICRLVGGMPLGILLAIAWVDVLSPGEIANEISRSLDFLATEIVDVPERQRSIRALFTHSWGRLTEAERAILMKLAVFRGGATRQAAQAVSGASLHDLKSLVSKSLLSRSAAGRYELHELLRQYAAEKLSEDPTLSELVHDQHCTYYCYLLLEQEPYLKGPHQQEALTEIEANFPNMRDAWNWAVAHNQVERIARALESLNRFYEWRGIVQEGEAVCRHAVEKLAATVSPTGLHVLARLLTWQAIFNRSLGNIERCEQLLRRSLAILDGSELVNQDMRAAKAFALLYMGGADREEAKQRRMQSLELYRAINDKWGTATALEFLAGAYQMLGNHIKADAFLQESLQIRQELGYQTGIGISLRSLGLSAMDRGQHEKAEQLMRNSLEIIRQTRNPSEVALVLRTLGTALLRAGKFHECAATIEECIAIHKDQGGFLESAAPYTHLSHAILHLGGFERAWALTEPVLREARKFGDRPKVGHCLITLTAVALRTEKYADAQTMAKESVAIWQATGYRLFLGQALALTGFAASALGNFALAQQCFLQALIIGTTQSIILPLLYALPGAALLLTRQGKHHKAIEVFTSASCHPHIANSCWFTDVVGRQIIAAAEHLPAEVVTAAQKRGQTRDLWATAKQLLVELGEYHEAPV